MPLTLDDLDAFDQSNPLEMLKDVPVESRGDTRDALDNFAAEYVGQSRDTTHMNDFRGKLVQKFPELTPNMIERAEYSLFHASMAAKDAGTGREIKMLPYPKPLKESQGEYRPAEYRDDGTGERMKGRFDYQEKVIPDMAGRVLRSDDVFQLIENSTDDDLKKFGIKPKNARAFQEMRKEMPTAYTAAGSMRDQETRDEAFGLVQKQIIDAYKAGNPEVRQYLKYKLENALETDENAANLFDKYMGESNVIARTAWNDPVKRAFYRGGLKTASSVYGIADRDGAHDFNNAVASGARAAQERTDAPEWSRKLEDTTAGAVGSVGTAAVGAAAGSLVGNPVAGAVAASGITTFNDSYAQAKAMGKSDSEAAQFAGRDAAFEVGFEALGNKFIGLGMERIFTKEAMPAIKGATKAAIIRRAGMNGLKAIGEELPSEVVTTIAQNLNSKYSNVDPNAIDNLAADIGDTIAQTILAAGAPVTAKSIFHGAKDRIQAYRSATPEVQESIKQELASLPDNPSRKQAAEVGITEPTAAGRSEAVKEILSQPVSQPVEAAPPETTQTPADAPTAVPEPLPENATPAQETPPINLKRLSYEQQKSASWIENSIQRRPDNVQTPEQFAEWIKKGFPKESSRDTWGAAEKVQPLEAWFNQFSRPAPQAAPPSLANDQPQTETQPAETQGAPESQPVAQEQPQSDITLQQPIADNPVEHVEQIAPTEKLRQEFKDAIAEVSPKDVGVSDAIVDMMSARAQFKGVPLDEYLAQRKPLEVRTAKTYKEIKNSRLQKMFDSRLDKLSKEKGSKRGASGVYLDGQIFTNGKSIIYAFTKSATPETFVHEIGHYFYEDLSTDEQKELRSLYKIEDGKEFSYQQKEDFANDFVKYTKFGKHPVGKIQAIFEKLKSWIANIAGSRNMKPVNDEMHRFFDGMFSREAPPEFKSAIAEQSEFIHNLAKKQAARNPSLDAEDIAQDILMNSLDRWRQFKPGQEGGIRRWLSGSVANKFIDEGRKQTRRKTSSIGERDIESREENTDRDHALEIWNGLSDRQQEQLKQYVDGEKLPPVIERRMKKIHDELSVLFETEAAGAMSNSELAPKNADMDQLRESQGLPEIPQATKKSADDLVQQISDEHAVDRAEELATDVFFDRILSDAEVNGVRIRATQIADEIDAKQQQLLQTIDPQEKSSVMEGIRESKDKLNYLTHALRKTGTDAARALQSRQKRIEDWESSHAVDIAQGYKGHPLEKDELKKIEDLQDKLKATNSELDVKQKELDDLKKGQTDFFVETAQATSDELEQLKQLTADNEALQKEIAALKAQLNDAVNPPAVDLATASPDDKKRIARDIDKTKARVKKEQVPKSLKGLVEKYARAYAESGGRDRDEMMDQTFAEVSKVHSGITRDMVVRIFDNYGQFTPVSNQPVDKFLAESRNELQLLEKVADLQSKILPKKTGMGRYDPTPFARDAMKQISELLKDPSIQAQQVGDKIKTRLAGMKTRARNYLFDLNKQLDVKEKTVKNKGQTPSDAEYVTLKAEIEIAKKAYDEMFGVNGLTDQQRIDIAIKAAEKGAADYQKRIDNKDFSPRQRNTTPPDKLLDQARMERDVLRDLWKKSNPFSANYMAALAKLATLEKHLIDGTVPVKNPKKVSTDTRMNAINDRIKNIRRSVGQSDNAIIARLLDSIAKKTERMGKSEFAQPDAKKDHIDNETLLRLQIKSDELTRSLRAAADSHKVMEIPQALRAVSRLMNMLTLGLDQTQVMLHNAANVFGKAKQSKEAFVKSWQSLTDANYDKTMKEIEAHPAWPIFKRTPLGKALGSNVEQAEHHQGGTGLKVPGFHQLGNVSSAFQTVMRFGLWLEAWNATEYKTQDNANYIANSVGIYTGKAALPANMQSAVPLANLFLNSASYLASLVQDATLYPLWAGMSRPGFKMNGWKPIPTMIKSKISRDARKQILKLYGHRIKGYAINAGLLWLYCALRARDDEEWPYADLNPKSVTFGNIVSGNKTYSFMGGVSPVAHFGTKMLTGEKINHEGVKKKITGYDRFGETGRFVSSRLNPFASFVAGLLPGSLSYERDPVTHKFKESDLGTALKSAVTVTPKQIADSLKEEGIIRGVPDAFLQFFGMKVTNLLTNEEAMNYDLNKLRKESTSHEKNKDGSTNKNIKDVDAYRSEIAGKERKRKLVESAQKRLMGNH